MLMPSGGIAKIIVVAGDTSCKISGLARDRGAALSHRITKCAKPVTVSAETAPFVSLWRSAPPGPAGTPKARSGGA
jgi:hypothetical protein